MTWQVLTTSLALLPLFLATLSSGQQKTAAEDSRGRKIHFGALVVDTHIDTTPKLERPEWAITERQNEGHVDLPRMREGGLDAVFFSIYMNGRITGPPAVAESIERISAVHELVRRSPAQFALCRTADQVRQAHRAGKVAALMGMEGGHMINNSLPTLRMYAALGVRYLTLTHGVHTDWADSSGQEPKHNGLTDFGKQVVGELNRLGVMVDISHVADKTFWDALEVSRAPLIASHSSCRALADHPRNMTDEMIKALAKGGGVIQITFVDSFIDPALRKYQQQMGSVGDELRAQFPGPENAARRNEEIEKRFGPRPVVSWERIVDHIDHAVGLVGPDHVGIGSDFDGATMPRGMEDCSMLPKITEALVARGYKQKDIEKILGGNLLRVMEEVEKVAALK